LGLLKGTCSPKPIKYEVPCMLKQTKLKSVLARPTVKYKISGKCDPPYEIRSKREVLLFTASLPCNQRRRLFRFKKSLDTFTVLIVVSDETGERLQ
jgi:hypothetical protein